MRVPLKFISICLVVGLFGAESVAETTVAFHDPVPYCQAVGTVDSPGANYVGPAAPHWIVTKLHAQSPVVWRCYRRSVLACEESSTTACGKAPWLDSGHWRVNRLIIQTCRANKDEECTDGTHCIWACRQGRPVLNRNQYPTDQRGFVSSDWHSVRGN
jgi:hypothetical protein